MVVDAPVPELRDGVAGLEETADEVEGVPLAIVLRKTTSMDAVLFGRTWSSATKLDEMPHGKVLAVDEVPATWVAWPRKRYPRASEDIAPVVDDPGAETSVPTSCTSSPVLPVMSTARIEPSAARQVPTLTVIGVVVPDIKPMDPVAWNPGDPLVDI